MHACKSNFPRHGVPCFQHIHQRPTRLTLPEGTAQPVFHIWKNPEWSALVPVPHTQDHAGHVHSATGKGLSAAPVPLHGVKGERPMLQQSSTTRGQIPVTCKPATPSKKGIPAWHCFFPQSPSKAAPQDCPALLCLRAAPDKMCQNLPKHALTQSSEASVIKSRLWDVPKVIRKKEKKAFSCPSINSCFTLS